MRREVLTAQYDLEEVRGLVIARTGFLKDTIRELTGWEYPSSLIKYKGYIIKGPKFEDKLPKLICNTELDLPEGKKTNPKALTKIMRKAARRISDDRLQFRLRRDNMYKYIKTLDSDPVFGDKPIYPKKIRYFFNPNHEPFARG